MNKIKMNLVGGAPATKPKLNRGGSPYMTLEAIIAHNLPQIAVLKKNKNWNCTRMPVVTVVEQIKIISDRHNQQGMIGWKLTKSKVNTDIVIIVPYNTKQGITSVYSDGEYEYI